eukprot:6213913-Pleurochrysis_carterae.AAC.2
MVRSQPLFVTAGHHDHPVLRVRYINEAALRPFVSTRPILPSLARSQSHSYSLKPRGPRSSAATSSHFCWDGLAGCLEGPAHISAALKFLKNVLSYVEVVRDCEGDRMRVPPDRASSAVSPMSSNVRVRVQTTISVTQQPHNGARHLQNASDLCNGARAAQIVLSPPTYL